MTLKIFIGWDSRFPICADVLKDSIEKRASCSVQIKFLKLYELRRDHQFRIKEGAFASTEFTYSRFLIPHLCKFSGHALFLDNDMLCYGDIKEIYDLVTNRTNRNELPTLTVKKHKHVAHTGEKMYGVQQTQYPRKNWSSMMLMNCSKLECWTKSVVRDADGARLHQFKDISDGEIAELPPGWNDLTNKNEDTKLLHYTEGGPWYDDYEDCAHSEDWIKARDSLH